MFIIIIIILKNSWFHELQLNKKRHIILGTPK